MWSKHEIGSYEWYVEGYTNPHGRALYNVEDYSQLTPEQQAKLNEVDISKTDPDTAATRVWWQMYHNEHGEGDDGAGR